MPHGYDPALPEREQFFPGDGEIARRMRAFDWTGTDLGQPESWPQNLRGVVSLCLTSRSPLLLWWGPNFTLLYNDACAPLLGESWHPRCLGAAGRECREELWEAVGPALESVRATGQGARSEPFPFFVARTLSREEVYLRFTYDPVLASDGRTVDGIFSLLTDVTDEIIGARRLETLKKLSAPSNGARDIRAACSAAAQVFAEDPEDIPFAAIYVADERGAAANLEAAVYPVGDHRLPSRVTLAHNGSCWPLASMLANPAPAVLELDSLGLQLSGRRWPDPIRTALLLPVTVARSRLSGILVFGTSPRRPLDPSCRTFFDLMARHVDAALRNALECQDAKLPPPELKEGQGAEEAVGASERRFRALVRDLSAGVYTCDAAGYITYFNEAAAALWGRTPEIGREQWCGSFRIRRPDGSLVALDTCPMALALKGEPVSSGEELILEQPDGTWRNVMVYPEAIRDASGVVSGAVNIVLDITEFKSAQQALQWSEVRFRRYFELGLVGMAMTSPEKGILEVNDELCRILGYERSELQQKTWAELTHPDDLAADVAQFNRAMAGEIDSYTMDKRWIRKDGQVVDSIVSAVCVRHSDGSVDYFICLLRDITRRKRAEQGLQESERRFHLLVESIPHLVWSFRTNGTLAYWNQRFADYTGLSEEELKQGAWNAVHPDDVPRLQQAWRGAWAHDAPFEMEYRLRRRDGSYRRFVGRGEPVPDSYGRMVEWFGTSTDVEDRRQAAEDLCKAHMELADMMRLTSMGELAASIAHEINQPLGAIVNNANVALRLAGTEEAALNEKLRDVLSDIVDDARRASAIIARQRELVQRIAPSREPLPLHDLVREVLALAQPELKERRITVRLEIRGDLPPVLGDHVQLQQVILNLVMNAAEAMSAVPDKRRILTIGGRLWRRNGQLATLITVHDVGCGFGTDDSEQLFKAFYTTKPNGLGMGLRIAHSIVEAHGGHLWAEPNPDAGATFFVALPGSMPG